MWFMFDLASASKRTKSPLLCHASHPPKKKQVATSCFSLCKPPQSRFLPPWLLPFRDEEHLRTACAVDVRSRMENSFDGLDVPWALLAVSVLGFLLGRTWTPGSKSQLGSLMLGIWTLLEAVVLQSNTTREMFIECVRFLRRL